MSNIVYMLKNKVPVIEPDINVWRRWYDLERKRRIVNHTVLENNMTILTIFLCDDLSRGEGRPEFFATSIWQGGILIPVGYWATWEEAETGHNCFVDIVKEWGNDETTDKSAAGDASIRS